MRRAERVRAEHAKETPRRLMEIDYLLQVDDEAREGALRLSFDSEGPFLASNQGKRIPLLIELPRLLSAATRVATDIESEDDLRILLAPGSSLGGARPKASVRDRDGSLTIAKFPRDDDDVKIVLWEAVALGLAPAYDLNPVPIDIKPRFLSTGIDTDNNTASLELAMQVADYFGIVPKVAKKIALQVAKAVKQWRQEALNHGIKTAEC